MTRNNWENAKKISITIRGLTDKQTKEIINEIYKKYGDKLYFAHWNKCKVLKK